MSLVSLSPQEELELLSGRGRPGNLCLDCFPCWIQKSGKWMDGCSTSTGLWESWILQVCATLHAMIDSSEVAQASDAWTTSDFLQWFIAQGNKRAFSQKTHADKPGAKNVLYDNLSRCFSYLLNLTLTTQKRVVWARAWYCSMVERTLRIKQAKTMRNL